MTIITFGYEFLYLNTSPQELVFIIMQGFDADNPGMAFTKLSADNYEQLLELFQMVIATSSLPRTAPVPIPPPGLHISRHWHLYDTFRQFVPKNNQDDLCQRPQPGKTEPLSWKSGEQAVNEGICCLNLLAWESESVHKISMQLKHLKAEEVTEGFKTSGWRLGWSTEAKWIDFAGQASNEIVIRINRWVKPNDVRRQ